MRHAGVHSFATIALEPQDHGAGLTNFALVAIGEGVLPQIEPPPPR